MSLSIRTPWQVITSVWYALFLREVLARTTADRMAWFWMLAEPIAMIGIMVAIRAFAMGSQHISGVEFIPWFIVGLFGFHLFRENMMRLIGAVEASKALFAYRQVKPIDPVFIRSYLEGMIKTFIFLMFIAAGVLLDVNLIPDNPLLALFYWALLWQLGLGTGLVLSAASTMIPEVGRIARITSFPLLLISGIFFPINYLPYEIQQYLLINPILHGVELLRSYFFDEYRMVAGISQLYLLFWVLALNAFGLLLHIRFEEKLKAK
jgi:capsular polysaccharide transport system permease protein